MKHSFKKCTHNVCEITVYLVNHFKALLKDSLYNIWVTYCTAKCSDVTDQRSGI